VTIYVVVAAAAIAVIAATAWTTASEYANLPDRVPMQFWFDGRPTSFGQRPVIWLIVGVQVLCLGIFAFTQQTLAAAPATHRHVLGMDLFGLCIIAMTANAQMMVIEAAKSLPDQRLPAQRYWLSFAVGMVLAIICAVRF
jgi:uncharacterized protein DUF1648